MISVLLLFWLTTVNAAIEADIIEQLPGQPPVKFKQYSGYISVDRDEQRKLFYYFVEAEKGPSSKPLVLWLNGGPGASSVGSGAFVENGPFRPLENHLVKNHYSWNKEANMLYLESPAGVGFSFSMNTSFYAYVDDEITARDNLVFLEQWLNRYPEFRNNEFYLTGASYAGHYVPQLAQLILKSKANINLKGIAIGNPLLEFDTDWNSKADFFRSHGMLSEETFELLNTRCNYTELRRQSLQHHYSSDCLLVESKSARELLAFVDAYDVLMDECRPSIQAHPTALHQYQHTQKIDVCVHGETDVYLNREDVLIALHARLVNVKRWTVFSYVMNYNMRNLEVPTISILGSLFKAGIRVIAYSGDQDSLLPFLGTLFLIGKLAKDLGLKTTESYHAWFEGKQVAGWTQVYGHNLSFATIRGASHESSFTQPKRSLALFRSFIRGNHLK